MADVKLASSGEVARQLGVGRWIIIYLVESGKIPEPQRIGGKRVFNEADIEKMRQILVNHKPRVTEERSTHAGIIG